MNVILHFGLGKGVNEVFLRIIDRFVFIGKLRISWELEKKKILAFSVCYINIHIRISVFFSPSYNFN